MVLSAWADGRGGLDLPADYAEQTRSLYGDVGARLGELCADIDRPPRPVGGGGRVADGERGGGRRRTASRSSSDRTSTSRSSTSGRRARPPAGTASAATGWPGSTRWRSTTRTERLVVATTRGRSYDVELRYESWVQLRSRPLRLRRDLAPLAARLQDEERGDATGRPPRSAACVPRLRSGDGDSSDRPGTASSSCSPTTWRPPRRPGTRSPPPRRQLTFHRSDTNLRGA